MTRVVTNASNLQIIYEDNHIIVVNKRVGDIVQGDKTQDPPLSDIVKEFLKLKYNKPGEVFLGVTHRLDRPTSGIVVFAKTSKALSRINEMFKKKSIGKKYWAIVQNPPTSPHGTLTHFLKKNPKTNTSRVYDKEIDGSKKAILHYKIKYQLRNYTLLEIDLETGRSHQIRSQLAHIGCPIKGDLKYGFNRSNSGGGIHLHAKSITFVHPISKLNLHLEAPTPKDVLWEECSPKHRNK